ncbi:hypothetical protein K1T71_001011 [Dendrolimus kikuchii]|uniref:Uncharacterized protein n=1 Tax=Dendrolimus kikuchii TaxID=765133 RepID=A0ACC1DGR9_9NEOP|nr:hypothetical protein K1T71_001011 [Dendrolimus kikuchii]
MDEAFEKLKQDGKNTVDNLVKWLQDSKLIETSKEAETKVRKFFDGVKDAKNVELAKFKEAVTKLAEEKKKTLDEANKMLSETGPQILNALQAGMQAVQGALGQSSK